MLKILLDHGAKDCILRIFYFTINIFILILISIFLEFFLMYVLKLGELWTVAKIHFIPLLRYVPSFLFSLLSTSSSLRLYPLPASYSSLLLSPPPVIPLLTLFAARVDASCEDPARITELQA